MTVPPVLLLLLLPAFQAPLPAPFDPPDPGAFADAVQDAWGAEVFHLIELDVPPEPPERARLAVPFADGLRVLLLERHSVRAPDFALRAWSRENGYADVPAPPPATYRGRVLGEPGMVAAASLLAGGWTADFHGSRGLRWALRPLSGAVPGAPPGLHVLFRADPCGAAMKDCGGGLVPGGNPPFQGPGGRSYLRRHLAWCQRRAEIAFDADFEYYQAKNSSVDDTVAAVEAILNTVDLFYARDVMIRHEITRIVVRTAPFYAPTGGGDLLDLFRGEWNTTLAGVPRDLAHLMTGKPGSLIEYGGLAYVGVVCNLPWAYGWSMDGANIVGHELGHNWGAGHCHDTEPCNNMCGACFFIAPNTKDIILAFRNSRDCLDPVLNEHTPLPPYAHPDRLEVAKADFDALGPVAFDVLANDHDGNCDPLHLDGFDAASARGGTVALSPGTGPDGRDELVYTPPPDVFAGDDSFGYSVADGTGLATAGQVIVTVLPRELAAYWPLDEGTGATAADAGASGLDGALAGAPVWTSGPFGGALEFDGVDDEAVVPALSLGSNHVSFTCWMRRNGTQGGFKGVIFSRDASTVAGLHFGTGNGLRYTWNGTADTSNWNPQLSVPDGQWVFVALVVEPEQATLYMHDGALKVRVNPVPHAPEEFDGLLYLGRDPLDASRRWRGALDDVRIYDQALTQAEVLSVFQDGGPASAPRPRDGGGLPDFAPALAWVPALTATAHELYFGTAYPAVRDATPASPEYQGSLGTPAFLPPPLAPGTTYFWRVDEETPGGLLTGQVWQFQPLAYHHWRLDETSGTVAADSGGGADGDYMGAVALGLPGASGATGTAAGFAAAPDRVVVPPLNLQSNRLTFTAWVRREGIQPDFAGIVFSRGGNTVAGLDFGDHEELRYHWDGGQWWWDPGLLVPDARWVFTALVIEPGRATLWLGDGGTLSSAVNVVSHASEEFDGNLVLARDPGFGARTLKGSLDDVRIYKAALNAREIRALYDATRP